MQSILQNDKRCYFTGATSNLHKHHIYPGNPNRAISDKNGFWVYISADYHNMTNNGVHQNPVELDKLKIICQKRFETLGHTRREFIKLIGKNYILEPEEFIDIAKSHYVNIINLKGQLYAKLPLIKAEAFIRDISDKHKFDNQDVALHQGIITISLTPYLAYWGITVEDIRRANDDNKWSM